MSDNSLDFIRQDLSDLKVYSPIKPLEDRAVQFGFSVQELAKLDANENAHGPPKGLVELLKNINYHIYPDPSQIKLREGLSAITGVPADQIVAGAGADESIDLVLKVVGPNRPIIITNPTFSMYKYFSVPYNQKVVNVQRLMPSFELDVPSIIKAIEEHKPGAVFITNPNNPTGNIVSDDVIVQLCAEARKTRTLVVVDEAYGEFGGNDCAPLLKDNANLVLLRTFSKWSGLAGLRIGYSISAKAIANVMMSIKQPYNISVAADVAARYALEKRQELLDTCAQLIKERDRMVSLLSEFSDLIQPLPTHSNFVLFTVTNGNKEAKRLHDDLERLGVLIRYYGNKPILQHYIRISAGRSRDTDKLIAAMRLLRDSKLREKVTKPKAIIFDMDGVLAEVSNSYRQAIIHTCKHFGANITRADIAEKKASSGFNNDWDLSLALIKERVKDNPPSFQQVKDVFQDLYLGTNDKKGFYTTESLIPSKSLLAFCANKVPLAIVTGRPKDEAKLFLDLYGIGEFFKATVCMEDTEKGKPDPQPVQKALDLLGITAGNDVVMIGDTPDDCRAAVAAGIIGLGILPPHDKANEKLKATMVSDSVGATCVLQDLNELRLLL